MVKVNFPPIAVHIWMDKLKNGSAVSTNKLERLLTCMTSDKAHKTVQNALKGGVLQLCGKGKRNVRFCKIKNMVRSRDHFCYECHLPGSLQYCKSNDCVRSFHRSCQRRDPQKPRYAVPSDKGQAHQLPHCETDLEDEDTPNISSNGAMRLTLIDESNVNPGDNAATPAPSIETNNNNSSCDLECDEDSCIYSLNYEDDIKATSFKRESDDDVLFVTETPAPARLRKQGNYVKSEASNALASDNADVDHNMELCTACRLLKIRELQNPPNMAKDELRFLLKCTWSKHSTWLGIDVRKYLAKNWNDQDISLIKHLLFQNNTLGVTDISANIECMQYSYLMEFLVDLLDLQHNIGIFFGTMGEEFSDTKWMMRDIMHDLREIRLCPDCFRHSNENHKSTFWFAKPCVQRHELVYAKHSSYPHWPAKVIRVLTKLNKYDVRFFGGSHSRALIPADDILPIDTDISRIKSKNTSALNSALKELKYYEALSCYPSSYFSFHADPNITQNVITTALSHYVEHDELNKNKRKRPLKRAGSIVSKPAIEKPQRKQPQRRCSESRRHDLTNNSRVAVDELESVCQNAMNLETSELASGFESHLECIEVRRKAAIATEKLAQCELKIKEMQRNVARDLIKAKRTRWCHRCLKKATFDCCFASSYCSMECQRRDKKRHLQKCRQSEL